MNLFRVLRYIVELRTRIQGLENDVIALKHQVNKRTESCFKDHRSRNNLDIISGTRQLKVK